MKCLLNWVGVRRCARRTHPSPSSCWWALLFAAFSIAPNAAFADAHAVRDVYAEALGQAEKLADEGEYGAALEVLERLAEDYPQDFRLTLRLAWLQLESQDYDNAESTFDRARELSGGNNETHLGLAWVALGQRRRDLAITNFDRVLSVDPTNQSAQQGRRLALTQRTLTLSPSVAATLHNINGQPSWWGMGFTLDLPAVVWQRLLLSASYRHISPLSTLTGSGRGQRAAVVPSQNEIYAAVGLTYPMGDVEAHYGHLLDTIASLDPVHVAGITGRYSPWGDIFGETSVSVYSDQSIWRFALSWLSPPLGGFHLQPGVAAQQMGDRTLVVGSLAALYAGEWWKAWLGAKWGDEERPTYLFQPSVYNIDGRILYGGWAGFELSPSDSLRFGLQAEVHNLSRTLSGSSHPQFNPSGEQSSSNSFLSLLSLVVALNL